MMLGFRGEGLDCVDTIKKVTILSRTENEEIGYEIKGDTDVIGKAEISPRQKGNNIIFYFSWV